jgi:uncharacterized repeat protein (TIGR03837 family)
LANPARFTADIFCRVVDNFGDIGVTWRLARQLSSEFGVAVRLFVDDLASFQRIAGNRREDAATVLSWPGDEAGVAPADIVIEAFACALPQSYVERMAARSVKPVWLNLEYLSAEPWVGANHLLPSPHPRLPLTKFFFFPGFDERTGGLIRERGLLAQRDQVLAQRRPTAASVFLFSYANAATGALIEAITATGMRITIPEGTAAADEAGRTRVVISPFVPQSDFDPLLWQHDILFVRGEDSFVRAQWAGKPFVWHIYPQTDGTHWVKLNAFLDRYCASLAADAAAALRALWQAWNMENAAEIGLAWRAFVKHRQTLAEHAEKWSRQLGMAPDLAANLVTFVEKTIKI